MISDHDGEFDSHSVRANLPSLMALRCFEAAARHEHFSRAADELHLTHGAVSRAVRLLEDDLGVALFERRSRRVFLTDAGRKLAQAVHDGLHLMRQAAHELRTDAARAQRGVLVAPMGFVEDGSHYCLLTPEPVMAGSAQSDLLGWLRAVA